MHKPRSHRLLIVAGLVGLLFFWLTDARYGATAMLLDGNARDAIFARHTGTVVGLCGSVVLLLLGAWLSLRRAS
jgi:hypothetical protein